MKSRIGNGFALFMRGAVRIRKGYILTFVRLIILCVMTIRMHVRNSDGDHWREEDIVLQKCYRNSRPLLITAHSIGFGIYREKEENEETQLVQLFEDEKLWEDIGYTVKEGVSVMARR